MKNPSPTVTNFTDEQRDALGQMAAMQGAAASLKVELSPVRVHDEAEIKGGIAAFARGSKGGLIVTLATQHRFARLLPCPLFRQWRRLDLLRTG
jgi:hypothetical protein